MRYSIVRLDDGMCSGNYIPLSPPETGPTVIGVVSENPSDSLDLRVWQPGKPDWMVEDRGKEVDAAVRLVPGKAPKALVSIWESTRTSNARVLVWEARLGSPKAAPTRTGRERYVPEPGLDVGSANPEGPIVIIPMEGTVGFTMEAGSDFFTAADLKRALAEAYLQRPSAIVFEITSLGGRVDTKDEILRVLMDGTARGQRFVAAVRDAGSAAALIALGCPEIVTFTSARMGSAVTVVGSEEGTISYKKLYEEDPELRKKYESYNDALDVEAALSTRRSPAISNAMKHSEAELWWSPVNGFSDKSSGPDSEQFDGPETVLTLTHTRMVDTGLSKGILDLEQIRQVLGLSPSRPITRVDGPMRSTSSRLEQLSREAEGADEATLARIRAQFVEIASQP